MNVPKSNCDSTQCYSVRTAIASKWERVSFPHNFWTNRLTMFRATMASTCTDSIRTIIWTFRMDFGSAGRSIGTHRTMCRAPAWVRCTFRKRCPKSFHRLRCQPRRTSYVSVTPSSKFAKKKIIFNSFAESSMKSNCDANQFSVFNETISDSLFEKFNNLSKNNSIGDRVISRLTIVKDTFATINGQNGGRKHSVDSDGGSSIDDNGAPNKLTLGISIIQGLDNNVYVKDLVKNGPGERNGVQIGDQVWFKAANWAQKSWTVFVFQILAVDGKSLLNLSYDESLKILQNTGKIVELSVSQIYTKVVPPAKHVLNVQPAPKPSTVRTLTRTMKNSFKLKKDRKIVEMDGSKELNGNYPTRDAVVNRNCENGIETSAIRVRSMPDLPKVSFCTEMVWTAHGTRDHWKVNSFVAGRRYHTEASRQ